jgi:hypothetical protein
MPTSFALRLGRSASSLGVESLRRGLGLSSRLVRQPCMEALVGYRASRVTLEFVLRS